MKNKRLVSLWLFVVGIGLFIFWGSLIAVDPLGIWHFPIIRGFNNYKVSQPAHLDFFKPYEYRMIKPDVVFLGSSRVYVGLCPDDYPDKSVKVYNMGMSSLSIRDAYQYLNFMIKVHKPQKVYLGLDFFQFDSHNFNDSRQGFSQERLDKISGSWFSYMAFKLQETAGLRGIIKPTVLRSQEERDTVLFRKGWDVQRGSALEANEDAYIHSLMSFFKTYQQFSLCDESFFCLEKIIKATRAEGIDLVLFFNPISADLLSLIWVTEQYDNFKSVKTRVAEITDYYDYAYINRLTKDRSLFYDASHYKSEVGKFFALSRFNSVNIDVHNVLSLLSYQQAELKKYLIKNWGNDEDVLRVLNDGDTKKARAIFKIKHYLRLNNDEKVE
ncbi:hypothetical protein [Aminobacterium sp. EBM-42]|uniref:hypothetical protein n=1 Tax=Aminobacterium sp. EBM-42 TaxID=1918503 RepID=UPI00257FD146|nr:hypothetical protein [Aminobacterium sp. EBM-42]